MQDFKGQNLAYSLTNYILYIGSLYFPSASTHPEGSLLAFLVGFVKQDMGTTVVLFLFTCLVAALVWWPCSSTFTESTGHDPTMAFLQSAFVELAQEACY